MISSLSVYSVLTRKKEKYLRAFESTYCWKNHANTTNAAYKSTIKREPTPGTNETETAAIGTHIQRRSEEIIISHGTTDRNNN